MEYFSHIDCLYNFYKKKKPYVPAPSQEPVI